MKLPTAPPVSALAKAEIVTSVPARARVSETRIQALAEMGGAAGRGGEIVARSSLQPAASRAAPSSASEVRRAVRRAV